MLRTICMTSSSWAALRVIFLALTSGDFFARSIQSAARRHDLSTILAKMFYETCCFRDGLMFPRNVVRVFCSYFVP